MVIVATESYADADIVYSYEISNSESGEIIDFKISFYSDKNRWKEDKLLTTVVAHRRKLQDILDYLGTTREDFERCVKDNFEDTLAIEDAIDSTTGDLIHVSFPSRFLGEGNKPGFKGYNDSYNQLNVFVNQEDYSCLFNDFDFFGKQAVEKASDFLMQGELINIDDNIIQVKAEIENMINQTLETGLLK